MDGSPPVQKRRQELVAAMQHDLPAGVETLQTLSRRDLSLLQLVVLRGPLSAAGISSILMLQPSQVAQALHTLEANGLIALHAAGSDTLVQATELSRRLRRVIAAIE